MSSSVLPAARGYGGTCCLLPRLQLLGACGGLLAPQQCFVGWTVRRCFPALLWCGSGCTCWAAGDTCSPVMGA